MQGVWIQSLVGELKSHMPGSMAKKKKHQNDVKKKKILSLCILIKKAGGSQSKTGK